MKKNLEEVSFMRPILIVLVVLYHAMAIHTGNWSLPEGTQQVGIYAIIGRIAYIFMLESFVFMSGYLYAHQLTWRDIETFSEFFRKKAKRLLLPCWLFGIVYALMFGWEKSPQENAYLVFCGIGHLWFLFMLFGCFVFTCVLLKFKQTMGGEVFLFLFVVSLFSFLHLRFHLSNIMYFLFFFYTGYLVYGLRDRLCRRVALRHVIVAWVLFLVFYVGLNFVRSQCDVVVDNFVLLEVCKKGCRVIYSLAGTLAFYITSLYVMRNRQLPKLYVEVGTACFGVYIFQQFILHILYYDTSLPSLLYPSVLPWFAFVLTLFISLALTWMIRLSSIGRNIL